MPSYIEDMPDVEGVEDKKENPGDGFFKQLGKKLGPFFEGLSEDVLKNLLSGSNDESFTVLLRQQEAQRRQTQNFIIASIAGLALILIVVLITLNMKKGK